jgi:hypothetical protein
MTPEEIAAEILNSYDYGPVVRSLRQRGFSRSEATAFLADFACDYARQLGGDLGAVGRVTELLADAIYARSADEHVEYAIQVLESVARCDQPELAIGLAEAHLTMAKLKLGME